MTDSQSRKPTAGGKAPAGPRRRPGRQTGRASRNALFHQSRVLAMQALYEEDITAHGLDDILQHMGELHRGNLTDAFAQVRGSAINIVETIAFLVRQADLESPEGALPKFEDAAARALQALADSPDDNLAEDDVPNVRSRAEQLAKPILAAFRRAASKELQRAIAAAPNRHDGAQPTRDSAQDLADHLARLRAGAKSTAAGEEPGDNRLSAIQHETLDRLRKTLAEDERTARAELMEMLQRTGRLARGVREREAEIDPRIERAAPAFPIPQLASIDRSVLRVALFELLYEPDVPYKVVVNEAVEIAKRYGGPNSGKFVNGVLRTIGESLPPERRAAP